MSKKYNFTKKIDKLRKEMVYGIYKKYDVQNVLPEKMFKVVNWFMFDFTDILFKLAQFFFLFYFFTYLNNKYGFEIILVLILIAIINLQKSLNELL